MSNINFDFTGQNYIVTGASSGIGKQISIELADAGATVIAVARDEEKLNILANSIKDREIITVALDACNIEVVVPKLKNVIDKYGKISGLVYAAGICDYTPLKKYDVEMAHKIMDTSFWASMNWVQLLSKQSYSMDRASFVLFSSVSAFNGRRGVFAYSAAKAAVSNAVKSVSSEIAKRGLRINAVCPGRVMTKMTKDMPEDAFSSRYVLGEGMPYDIAGSVLFLLSDRARWITGTSLIVDGGFLAD